MIFCPPPLLKNSVNIFTPFTQFPADSVTFTAEIFHGKLYFQRNVGTNLEMPRHVSPHLHEMTG